MVRWLDQKGVDSAVQVGGARLPYTKQSSLLGTGDAVSEAGAVAEGPATHGRFSVFLLTTTAARLIYAAPVFCCPALLNPCRIELLRCRTAASGVVRSGAGGP